MNFFAQEWHSQQDHKRKWESVAQELWKVQEDIKRMEKAAQRLKEELKVMSNDQSFIGFNYAFIKEYRSGSIDYNLIPELRLMDLDQYRKADVTIWKLNKVSIAADSVELPIKF